MLHVTVKNWPLQILSLVRLIGTMVPEPVGTETLNDVDAVLDAADNLVTHN